jgi:hypothetical protein
MKMNCKYPNVSVKLVGEDGNAFAILGRVTRALRKAKVPATEIKAFQDEATSGDYNNLLATVMRWVQVGEEWDYQADEEAE